VQWRQRLADKDEEIENLKRDMEYRDQEMNQQKGAFGNKDDEIARLKADMDRLRAEAQAKILQAQERIKELNQKLLSQTGKEQSGMKR
jgi:chromosome segregation ATPase